MIAVTRLLLPDCNIAATTALQALHPLGREMGLKAGANVLMPIITLPKFRKDYLLYDNKPCVDDTPLQCRQCIAARVASVGGSGRFRGSGGDAPHFQKKHEKNMKEHKTGLRPVFFWCILLYVYENRQDWIRRKRL